MPLSGERSEDAVAVIPNDARAVEPRGVSFEAGVDEVFATTGDLLAGKSFELASLAPELSHTMIPPPAIRASNAITIYLKVELSACLTD